MTFLHPPLRRSSARSGGVRLPRRRLSALAAFVHPPQLRSSARPGCVRSHRRRSSARPGYVRSLRWRSFASPGSALPRQQSSSAGPAEFVRPGGIRPPASSAFVRPPGRVHQPPHRLSAGIVGIRPSRRARPPTPATFIRPGGIRPPRRHVNPPRRRSPAPAAFVRPLQRRSFAPATFGQPPRRRSSARPGKCRLGRIIPPGRAVERRRGERMNAAGAGGRTLPGDVCPLRPRSSAIVLRILLHIGFGRTISFCYKSIGVARIMSVCFSSFARVCPPGGVRRPPQRRS